MMMHRLQGTLQRKLNLTLSRQLGRGFSTTPRWQSESTNNDTLHIHNDGTEKTVNSNKQPFVDGKLLQPGEWDINRRDPYSRPKPPRNKLISAEDFANRPPVGFDNEFSSYGDSMISLSWLDERTCKSIYSSYVGMMLRHQTDNPGRTSHEYVCRALAQQFQITTWRAAGVVQLQHAEEQMRRNNPELLCEDQAAYAEDTIKKNIADAYKSQRAQPPNRGPGGQQQPFVEDPVGIHGLGEPDEISSSWVATDDIYDMETKLHQANVRDEKLAKILIDEHVYKEDVDESTFSVKTDGVAKRLIRAQRKQKEKIQSKEEHTKNKKYAATTDSIPNTVNNGQGNKRPRWKFAAKVVNTRAMKKKGRKITSYTNNNMENTLVEENGILRVATVEEGKNVAWKPTRTKSNEYIYDGVKKAWLEKTIERNTGVWGKAPRTAAADVVVGHGIKKDDITSAKTPSKKEHIVSYPVTKEPEKEEKESFTSEAKPSSDDTQNKEGVSNRTDDNK
mmetsp:Transcript_50856/g.58783  ORF Transcript_50856/g.58783 Transcript_50856/m.58783 type:complete len:504 (+) Transcript_50856:239-1750(+)